MKKRFTIWMWLSVLAASVEGALLTVPIRGKETASAIGEVIGASMFFFVFSIVAAMLVRGWSGVVVGVAVAIGLVILMSVK